MNDLFNQTAPYQPTSATSREAAEAIKPVAGRCRRQVLEGFRSFGNEGATRQEIADFIGMSGDTLRPRVLELARIGALVNTGRTRFTPSLRRAEIWRITQAGAAMLL